MYSIKKLLYIFALHFVHLKEHELSYWFSAFGAILKQTTGVHLVHYEVQTRKEIDVESIHRHPCSGPLATSKAIDAELQMKF